MEQDLSAEGSSALPIMPCLIHPLVGFLQYLPTSTWCSLITRCFFYSTFLLSHSRPFKTHSLPSLQQSRRPPHFPVGDSRYGKSLNIAPKRNTVSARQCWDGAQSSWLPPGRCSDFPTAALASLHRPFLHHVCFLPVKQPASNLLGYIP